MKSEQLDMPERGRVLVFFSFGMPLPTWAVGVKRTAHHLLGALLLVLSENEKLESVTKAS